MDSSIILYGLSGSILVTMLVQVARTFGLPPRFAPPAAIIAGFIVSAAFHAAQPGPWGSTLNWWIQTVIDGLQLGLGGAGIYSLTTAHQKAKDEEALNNMGVPTSLKSMSVLQGAPITAEPAAPTGVFVPPGQQVASVKQEGGVTAVQFTEPEPDTEWLSTQTKARVEKRGGQFTRLPPEGFYLDSSGALVPETGHYIGQFPSQKAATKTPEKFKVVPPPDKDPA